MKLNSYVLPFVLLALLSTTPCFAKYSVADLDSDYKKSCSEFQSTRQGASVKESAQRMAHGLTDVNNIVERLATEDEKKVIYKSIFGSVIAFGLGTESPQQIFDAYYAANKLALESSKYAPSFKAISLINDLAYGLLEQFKKGGFAKLNWHSQINKKLNGKIGENLSDHIRDSYEELLTTSFISWFCEALADYYVELDFVPASDREWFAEVQKQAYKRNYQKPKRSGRFYDYWIYSEDRSRFIGVFRQAPLREEDYPPELNVAAHKKKLVRDDLSGRFLTNLVTGLMDFSEVVSREIPVQFEVRYKDERMQLNPANYTGFLTKFTGSFAKAIPSKNSEINDLVRSIHKTQSERNGDKTGYYIIRQPDIEDELVYNFNESKVQVFAQEKTLSSQDLFKILIFIYITNSEDADSYSNNIIFALTNGQFKPILADHRYTWQKYMAANAPRFYELVQAGNNLESSWMQGVLDVVSQQAEKFGNRIFGAYCNMHSFKPGYDFGFDYRLKNIRDFCSKDQTLRAITNALYGKGQLEKYIIPVSQSTNKNDICHPNDSFLFLEKWIYSMDQNEYETWKEVLQENKKRRYIL